jgi:hypothetical protein
MCFVWISEKAAFISVHNINLLIFIIAVECVYCAVRSVTLVHLNVARTRTNPRGLRKLATSSDSFACLEQKVLAVFSWNLLKKILISYYFKRVRDCGQSTVVMVVMCICTQDLTCRYWIHRQCATNTQNFCSKFSWGVTTIQGPNSNESDNSCVHFFGLFTTLSLCQTSGRERDPRRSVFQFECWLCLV